MRLILVVLFVLPLVVVPANASTERRLYVVATIEPVASIVKYIGSPYVTVDFILPSGADLHSYALSVEDVEKLRRADLVVLINSSFFALEREIRERLVEESFHPLIVDYYNYSLAILDVPGLGRNFHGVWMYPDNALAIARVVARALAHLTPERTSFFYQRLDEFARDMEILKQELIKTARDLGVFGKKAVVAVPCVAYVVEAFGVHVAGTLMRGHGVYADERALAEYAEMARRGEIAFIACPEHLKEARIRELADSLAEETRLPVVEFRIFSAGGVEDYFALMLYNAAALRNSLARTSAGAPLTLQDSVFLLVVGVLLAALGALTLRR